MVFQASLIPTRVVFATPADAAVDPFSSMKYLSKVMAPVHELSPGLAAQRAARLPGWEQLLNCSWAPRQCVPRVILAPAPKVGIAAIGLRRPGWRARSVFGGVGVWPLRPLRLAETDPSRWMAACSSKAPLSFRTTVPAKIIPWRCISKHSDVAMRVPRRCKFPGREVRTLLPAVGGPG